MNYAELSSMHQKEVDAFPLRAAFSPAQLKTGMEALGVESKNELHDIGGGCFIRRSDKDAFYEMMERHSNQLEKALEDDAFAIGALIYELNNHEYVITGNPSEAMEILDFNIDNPRHVNLLNEALQQGSFQE